MSRVKETAPGSGELPQYKSPPSRINISLRAGYDNLRLRVKEKSGQISQLRGNKRDLENSRDNWKQVARERELELTAREKELEVARRRVNELETQLKKK